MSVLVIGSGPSGVHAALTLLERGAAVTMLDVGHSGAAYPHEDTPFSDLPNRLDAPMDFFLGKDFKGASVPARKGSVAGEYYGLPPSKDYVFEAPGGAGYRADGLDALRSYGRGGLAECWTAGAYTFSDDDLADFPISYADLAPSYDRVAERIGVGGLDDDLAAFLPVHQNLSAPVDLDLASADLQQRYLARRDRIAQKTPKLKLGRSRQAALSQDLGDRSGCTQCGRCLWGCPNGALYTPRWTLAACQAHPNFAYLPGRQVHHLETDAHNRVVAAIGYQIGSDRAERFDADQIVLAAGTLGTAHIYLRTVLAKTGEVIRLSGLMDNRQVLAPFYNTGMLGRAVTTDAYQYHQLALGIETEDPRHYVHGQITTFVSGDVHPIARQLPLPLPVAAKIFEAVRAGLGVVNLNFHDTRRAENFLTLSGSDPDWPDLVARYRPEVGERARIGAALKDLRRAFRALGAPVVPGMTHIRPMGASVHYSGTLPHEQSGRAHTVGPEGQSADFENLYVVDGSVFPFLPAKNLTLTLMANATRIAEAMPIRAT